MVDHHNSRCHPRHPEDRARWAEDLLQQDHPLPLAVAHLHSLDQLQRVLGASSTLCEPCLRSIQWLNSNKAPVYHPDNLRLQGLVSLRTEWYLSNVDLVKGLEVLRRLEVLPLLPQAEVLRDLMVHLQAKLDLAPMVSRRFVDLLHLDRAPPMDPLELRGWHHRQWEGCHLNRFLQKWRHLDRPRRNLDLNHQQFNNPSIVSGH